jgi:LmbE family N-acetylglucosaminyl deacetylase
MAAIYVGMGMSFFSGDATWAHGNAEHLRAQTHALAQQAALVDPGGVGERTSWYGVYELMPDQSLRMVRAWHLGADGQVKEGLPNAEPGPAPEPPAEPAWAPGIAVKVGEVYTYAGARYAVVQAHATQVGWEPPALPALWRRL